MTHIVTAARLSTYLYLTVAAVLFSFIGAGINTVSAQALSGSEFNAGRIIDDDVFYNDSAMSASGIQTFLEQKVQACDTQGTQRAYEFGRSDLTRAQYAALKGWQSPPYTCLRDYKQNTPQMEAASGLCGQLAAGTNRTSAQIISDIGKACDINPQVLLVLLQKEQSLILDTWPLQSQYKNATGFACPDTAPCDPSYGGFFYQVYHAARQFQVYKKYPNSYNYVAGRFNNVYFNPNLSGCGSSSIYIENQATAALYIYTPYQPNQAALNNLYGTGDNCSAYGNRNFWRLFSDWFGSTTGPAYAWKETSQKIYYSDSKTKEVNYEQVEQGQYVYIEYTVQNTGHVTWPKGQVLLGRNGDSPFCIKNEWSSCARATVANKNTAVAPGQSLTFGFWMKAPDTAGSYKIYWNLLIENVSWFADIGSHHNVTVVNKKPTSVISPDSDFVKIGNILTSPDGNSVLTLRPTGDLSIYYKGKPVQTIAKNVYQLRQQQDGNLVAYSKAGDVVWVRGDGAKRQVTISNDGKLTYKTTPTDPGITLTSWTIDSNPRGEALTTNTILFAGQTVFSNNNRYRLTLQNDGNLVLYGPSGAKWAVGENKGHALIQQSDGNLVLYSYQGAAVWSSNIWLANGSQTQTFIQGDGNIVTYDKYSPIWSL
jgi:hypothetical protein